VGSPAGAPIIAHLAQIPRIPVALARADRARPIGEGVFDSGLSEGSQAQQATVAPAAGKIFSLITGPG
jgi:hypothetical protein